MAKKRINWIEAKTDYITNVQQSYASIAKKYGVSDTSVEKTAAKEGWVALREETQLELQKALPKKLGEELAEVNSRHAVLGRKLQTTSETAINDGIKPKNYEQARLGILTGVNIERQALNIQDQKPVVAIQINFGDPRIKEWGK